MKRYPFEGKSMSRIHIIGFQKPFVETLYIIYKYDSHWYASYNTCCMVHSKRIKLHYEGLGLNGPILSVIIHNRAMFGELVTDKLTGRNLIFINTITSPILRLRMNEPRSTWNQAVQLAAFKWISERRSA